MNSFETGDPLVIQRHQIEMNAKQLGTAQEPAITARPTETVNTSRISEYPVRFVPRVEIYVGALLNNVNEVAEHAQTYQDENAIYSLIKPLSNNANGIAVAPMMALYDLLQEIANTPYMFIAENDAAINEYTEAFTKRIQAQLVSGFKGEPIETEGEDYVINPRDFFTTSVGVGVAQTLTTAQQTVNNIELVVSVYMHGANLTGTEQTKDVFTSYRQIARNYANASGVDTSLAVLFDVANFQVRPSILSLFSSLVADKENVLSVEPVSKAEHLPSQANLMLNLRLTKKSK